ncbi:hypothetical protein ACN261_20450 [Micromonospora sp. WMMD723]|uniref:hypothetical protein n=1 Tax=Micromonospora sp. WMMD723 TaxID=3403465 RepID=UPI003CF7AED6
MSERKSLEELVSLYGGEECREPLQTLLDLRELLTECIIRRNYRVSREMYETVKLSPLGERVTDSFVKKGIKYPEARFICYLRLFHTDLLIDPVGSDHGKLAEIVSKEIQNREILFPYTYGRALYDKINSMPFGASRNFLTAEETQEVLDGTPQGVFQLGRFITGPFGLIKSPIRRVIPPKKDIPFHCSDTRCTRTHYRNLSSDQLAPVNEWRSISEKIFDKDAKNVSDWRGFLKKIDLAASNVYDDLAGDCVAYLIGDSLTLDEQRRLVEWLLDNTKNEVRQVASAVGLKNGPSARMAGDLNAAELLQLTLCASNVAIFSGIDTLVMDETIKVPLGEVRRPVVNQGEETGAYGLEPELGRFGLRIRSSDLPLGLMRLRRLVGQMYRMDDERDRQDLEWQLRGEEGPSLEAKIEHYLQRGEPRQVVSSLLLARRSNFVVAASRLSLAEEILTTDDERVNAVMWKLGFSVEDLLDPHKDFWQLHEKVLQALRQAPPTLTSRDVDRIRGNTGAYFPQLESVLREALYYTTWALTTDHASSPRPFVYRPSVDEEGARLRLDALGRGSRQEGEFAVRFNTKPDLYALTRGFQILGDLLSEQEALSGDFERAASGIPDWAAKQELQSFAFRSTSPFLNLLPDSRSFIVQQLRMISQRLVSAEAHEARNEWAHGRQSIPDIEILKRAVDAIRDAVTWLEDAGFCRQVFRRVKTTSDDASRQEILFLDGRGREFVFHRPSRFSWLDLPSLGHSQHIMPAARFAEPNEVLRFVSESDSPFAQMWQDYPVRTADPSNSGNVPHAHSVKGGMG